MFRRKSSAVVALFAIGATVCAGCGDGRPARVPVSGTVRIDGGPLRHGAIMFVPIGSRPSGGMLDDQGRFTLSCYERGDGALIGRHQVKITAAEPVSEGVLRWHAPKRYADVESSDIVVEITEPKDDLLIELTWDGGAPFVER